VLERRTSSTGVVYYVSPLLAAVGVPHGFSTRIGGASTGPFGSLNLGNPSGSAVQDEWQRIHENYRRLQAAIGFQPAQQRCWVHQVHGADVVFVRRGQEFTSGARADALVCDDPNRIIAVRVADCAPLLLASDDGRVVAAVHAGWRGVLAGVVPNAVRELRRMCSAAGQTQRTIFAAVGPCIGRRAFEVGPEVLEQFQASFGERAPVDRNSACGKGHLDLRAAIRIQLLQAGLSDDCIDSTDLCTYGDAAQFFSHRRDRGITGRMAALISPRHDA